MNEGDFASVLGAINQIESVIWRSKLILLNELILNVPGGIKNLNNLLRMAMSYFPVCSGVAPARGSAFPLSIYILSPFIQQVSDLNLPASAM